MRWQAFRRLSWGSLFVDRLSIAALRHGPGFRAASGVLLPFAGMRDFGVRLEFGPSTKSSLTPSFRWRRGNARAGTPRSEPLSELRCHSLHDYFCSRFHDSRELAGNLVLAFDDDDRARLLRSLLHPKAHHRAEAGAALVV